MISVDYIAQFEILGQEGITAPLYFHIKPQNLQNGWDSSPWGHLSRERECIGSLDACLLGQNCTTSPSGHFDSRDNLDSLYPKVHRQDMDGVRMFLKCVAIDSYSNMIIVLMD